LIHAQPDSPSEVILEAVFLYGSNVLLRTLHTRLRFLDCKLLEENVKSEETTGLWDFERVAKESL
jgi:hypothetical protein